MYWLESDIHIQANIKKTIDTHASYSVFFTYTISVLCMLHGITA